MAANINDKITSARSGGSNANVTTVSGARAIGGTSLSCVDLSNWPSESAVHFITYKKKADGSINKATQCDWKGVVSANTIGSLTLENGSDAGNDVGDFVEAAPTSAWAQDLHDGLTTSLNADGTLKDSIVTTSKIANSSITAAKTDWSTFATTWNDVKAQRSPNTDYTNTHPYPIEVTVAFDFLADSNSSRWRQGSIYVDGVRASTMYTEELGRSIMACTVTVPPGATYNVSPISSNAGKTGIYAWTELS